MKKSSGSRLNFLSIPRSMMSGSREFPSICHLVVIILPTIVCAFSGQGPHQPPPLHPSRANRIRQSKRPVAKVDGDIILGALFPVHRQPQQGTEYTRTRQCGPIWEQYGMHRIEVFLKTLDEINANDTILPNVTLGCDIRDSCWFPPVALEQSIDFIKNSIASLENLNVTGPCAQKKDKPIAGLIGPGSSTVTVQIQNLLSLFNIPQIGYSATSKDLSDKSLYEYFLRVVPSDQLQAKALVDIVLYFNWTYISTVYTEGTYGFSGMQEFSTIARNSGLCEAASEKVPNNADEGAYDQVIRDLLKTPNARIVVCFCEGMTIKGLVAATKRQNVDGTFLFIGSDGWNVRRDVVDGVEEAAAGGISIKLYSPPVPGFDEYYFGLRPYPNNSRDPWFREFWQEKFRCSLDDGDDRDDRFNTSCTGREDLSQNYTQDAKLGFVYNSIYTMAWALHHMHVDLCGGEVGLCDKMSPINGSIFLRYLLNTSFVSYSNDLIAFDSRGDPPGRYEIMNFQKLENGSGYDYVRIGNWVNGSLQMDDTFIFWPNKGATINGSVLFKSVCSEPCAFGQIMQLQQGGLKCCWTCIQCKEYEFVFNDSTCQECKLGWWPNDNLTECVEIEIEHMKWGDTEALVAICFSFLGIMSTLFVTFVFFRHNDTPVVKASTRELSYIILLGIILSYVSTFPLVAKPTTASCYAARILPGFSFSLIYGALVTKTNRIARILAGSKKKIMTRKPRFMSASAQVVITILIIAIESTVIGITLVLYTASATLIYPTRSRSCLVCRETKEGIVIPLGFNIFLIAMCTLYAVKTRNLPENFNEAKFIGFTMYTTCIIWIAFVPIYFGSDNKVITMCLAVSFSATVALVLLFLPKIYIIIYRPEKNNRSAFTTSKDVRCHIGTGSSVASNRPRSMSTSGESGSNTDCRYQKPFEKAAMQVCRQKDMITRWKSKKVKSADATLMSSGGPSSTKLSLPSGSPGLCQPSRALPRLCETDSDSVEVRSSTRIVCDNHSVRMRDGDNKASIKIGLIDLEQSPSLGKVVDDAAAAGRDMCDSEVQTGDELMELWTAGGLRHRKSISSALQQAGTCSASLAVRKMECESTLSAAAAATGSGYGGPSSERKPSRGSLASLSSFGRFIRRKCSPFGLPSDEASRGGSPCSPPPLALPSFFSAINPALLVDREEAGGSTQDLDDLLSGVIAKQSSLASLYASSQSDETSPIGGLYNAAGTFSFDSGRIADHRQTAIPECVRLANPSWGGEVRRDVIPSTTTTTRSNNDRSTTRKISTTSSSSDEASPPPPPHHQQMQQYFYQLPHHSSNPHPYESIPRHQPQQPAASSHQSRLYHHPPSGRRRLAKQQRITGPPEIPSIFVDGTSSLRAAAAAAAAESGTRRLSDLSTTSSGGRSISTVSLEDAISQGLKDPPKPTAPAPPKSSNEHHHMAQFQEFLWTKGGVRLDLNSVQSSDV